MKHLLLDIDFIQQALDQSTIVTITDAHGTILYANDYLASISQYEKEELIGRSHRILNSGYHDDAFFRDMWRTITHGKVWKGEIKNKAKDGSYYWVDTTIIPFLDDKGNPYRYVSIRHDITKQKELEEKMEILAFYDPLTDLPNLQYLKERLEEVLDFDSDDYMVALFLDLDGFKPVNDHYGHDAGDILIKKVARRIHKYIPEDAFVFRRSGDEFVVLLQRNDIQEVEDIAKVLGKQLARPYTIRHEKVYTTSSIGIAVERFPKEQGQKEKGRYRLFVEKLMTHADISMYEAKEKGGNMVCMNNREINEATERKFKMEEALRKACKTMSFFLCYQPVVSMETSDIVGLEVLLRWKHPEFGEVSPAEFIPVLERMGAIPSVGRWVLKSALLQWREWVEKEVPGVHEIERIMVNVSPMQLCEDTFLKDISRALKVAAAPASLLELEITESSLMDVEQAKERLGNMKRLGVRLSIDDFGTGYSSLSYIKNLPIDTLKIDRSFLQDLNKEGKVIIDAVVSMGRHLGFGVLAEGIESEEVFGYIKEAGIDWGQGYYFSPPLPPEKLEIYLTQTPPRRKA